MKEENSIVLLIDNQGLSHYTCYLAKGLSKYKHIRLIGFSKKDFVITDAYAQANIVYDHLEQAISQNKSLWKLLIKKPFVIFKHLLYPVLVSNYRVIHIQGHLPLFFLYTLAIKLKRRRLVWTVHDVDLRPSSAGIRGKIETMYVSLITQPNILLAASDVILVHGNNLKAKLIQKGVSAEKIQLIPHFDYLYLQKYSKTNFRYEEPKYILFFGNIKPYKGLNIFLKALDIVERNVNLEKLSVLIAGKGSLTPYNSLLTKDKLKYIKVRNEDIPTEQIPNIFKNAEIVVLPYVDASQSGIIPLAYTFSKPVIVSDVGSLSEYVEHGKTGYVFENGNIQQLAHSIIRSINEPLTTSNMGINAHKKLLSQMSLEVCCDIINSRYDDI